MKKLAVCLLACVAAFAGTPGEARAGQCGLQDSKPLWIDFADGSVPFWQLFAQPGIIAAASNFVYPPQLRAGGAKTVYWDMYMNKRVGTPTAPADPAVVEARANRLFDYAALSSDCATPVIGLNELFGAGTTTPWSETNAQYRANVLTLLRVLAARGARPFLQISSRPYTGGEAAEWWRQAAQVADLVREIYFSAPQLYERGPIGAGRHLRLAMRRAVSDLLAIGIPPSRIGITLGFQTRPGYGGREGLKPAHAWFETVKWQALAARQVTRELGIASIWSWGWGAWTDAARDPDKEAAACVYLWTRDPRLCDGPVAAGPHFNASRTEGQLLFPAGAKCSLDGRHIRNDAIARLAAMTGDRQVAFSALFARLVESWYASVSSQRVLAGERAVIALRFGGSRAAYRAALARAGATLAVARGVIADELRRARIEAGLHVASPSPAQVRAYYFTYSNVLTRVVEAVPAPWWLGGRTRGLALSSLAPAQVFSVPPGRRSIVLSLDGRYAVRALGQPRPLGALPLARARPAISAALMEFARTNAYHDWTANRQTAGLSRLICRRDELPAVGAVELATYLPFLALS